MAHDNTTANAEQPLRRLDRKLARVGDGTVTADDFIIADAKDADMAYGLTCAGPRPDTFVAFDESGPGRYRTRADYLKAMLALIEQGELDVILTSASPTIRP